MKLVLLPHQERAERWKPVVGYEDLYEVSDMGRVRSLDRICVKLTRWGSTAAYRLKGRMLELTIDRQPGAFGRLQVKLCGNDKQKTRLVHQLVAEAFLGLRPEGMEIAHGDGNAANNRLENLRYATPKQNAADKEAHGTALRGSMAPSAKLTEEEVRVIRRFKGRKTVQSIADFFEVSIAQVSRIHSGSRWGHLS